MAETGLTRKIGPLPAWAWGIIGGIAVYFLYTRYKNSSATGAVNSPTATVFDPNAVDPTTGLTYGQELSGGFPTTGGLQASTGSGSTADTSGVPPIDALDTELASFLQAQQDFGQVASAIGFTPPNPSANTLAAAGSAPLQNTSPPKPHPPVGSKAGPHGAIVAPYGHKPPPPKKGYTTIGTGSGGWIYKPLPKPPPKPPAKKKK